MPPRQGKQQFVASAWVVTTPPGWRGPTVTHPILATSRNPDSGLHAHAMPCPSLPASPTLSPALSTWHTWARGDWRHSPPLWGTKGRGRVGSRCHIPPPSLPPSLPLTDAVSSFVSPTGVAGQPGALWQCGGQWCPQPCCCWLCAACTPGTGPIAGSCLAHGPWERWDTMEADAPLPTCHLHCLPTGSCITQLFP